MASETTLADSNSLPQSLSHFLDHEVNGLLYPCVKRTNRNVDAHFDKLLIFRQQQNESLQDKIAQTMRHLNHSIVP